MTLCHFYILGNVEVFMERLIMWVMAGASSSAPSLTVLVSIKSTPVADEFFRPFIIFITSGMVTGLRLKLHCLFCMASFIFFNGSQFTRGILLLRDLTLSIKKPFMLDASPAGFVTILPP